MFRKYLRIFKEEEANGLVWFIFFFFILTGITGLVVDGGVLYKTKSELRKAANAAVLSGAQELKNNDTQVETVVNRILKEHNEENSLKDLSINHDSTNKVSITLRKDVPLYFMKLFNLKSTPVSVKSSAAIAPMTRTSGAVPFGIPENVHLEFGMPYELKVDAGDQINGNFGLLALSGPGAANYENDLMYGYQNELGVDDVVPTQTGNVEGKTVRGVNYRIDNSPTTEYNPAYRDDPRVIKILVYVPEETSVNQLKSIRIKSFAYFYLTEPMGHNDSSVKGYFIEKTGTGIGDPTAPNNGAYAIKLVE